MQVYQANAVDVFFDSDYGEGWLAFSWPNPIYGHDGLRIAPDGLITRERKLFNGRADSAELSRDHLTLNLPQKASENLAFERQIEIRFALSDEQFLVLQSFINYVY